MSKNTKKAAKPSDKTMEQKPTTENAPAQEVAAAPPAPAAAPAQTVKVLKAEQKYEGARAAWYAALLAHDGQSADAFVDACKKQPPSVPKSGKAEDPRGWLRYFVREGIAALG